MDFWANGKTVLQDIKTCNEASNTLQEVKWCKNNRCKDNKTHPIEKKNEKAKAVTTIEALQMCKGRPLGNSSMERHG